MYYGVFQSNLGERMSKLDIYPLSSDMRLTHFVYVNISDLPLFRPQPSYLNTLS